MLSCLERASTPISAAKQGGRSRTTAESGKGTTPAGTGCYDFAEFEVSDPGRHMRVAVFGLGFVGTITATGLASRSHEVCGVEVDPGPYGRTAVA